MANLTGFNIGANQRGILNIGSTINTPLDATLRAVTDGLGNASPLQLSTTDLSVVQGVVSRLLISTDITMRRNDNTLFFQYSNAPDVLELNGNTIRLNTLRGNTAIGHSVAAARLHVRAAAASIAGRFEDSAGVRILEIGNGGYNLIIGNNNDRLTGSSNSGYFEYNTNANGHDFIKQNAYASSGTVSGLRLNYSINNHAGTVNGILVNATETSITGTTHNLMDLQRGGVSQFRISVTDATIYASNYNISASVYLGNSIAVSSSGGVKVGSSRIRSDADANLTLLNDAANNFSLLKFGGTTNAFPALKRNGTSIDVRLADDSGYAGLTAGTLVSLGGIQAYSTIEGYSTGQSAGFSGSVRVGSGGNNVASAILECVSTTKGFLPPRQTEAQRLAISSPEVGLIVYQTDASDGLYVYKTGGWTLII